MLEILKALLEFQQEHDQIELERKWDGRSHWFIYYDRVLDSYKYRTAYNHREITTIYFSEKHIAIKAIHMLNNKGLI